MRTLLIVNPAAGHGRGEKVLPPPRAAAPAGDPRARSALFRAPGPRRRARPAGRRGRRPPRPLPRRGRDRLRGRQRPFRRRPSRLPRRGRAHPGRNGQLVPPGFRRRHGPSRPWRTSSPAAVSRVDLVEFEYRDGGRTERRLSLNIIGVGLIADILKLTNERLKGFGALGYSIAVLVRLARGMDNRIDIEADGRAWTVRDSALVISNSKYTGGGMMIAPPADVADGRADLVVFRGVNRREIVAIFSRVFSGRPYPPPQGRNGRRGRPLDHGRSAPAGHGRRRAPRRDAPAGQGPPRRPDDPGMKRVFESARSALIWIDRPPRARDLLSPDHRPVPRPSGPGPRRPDEGRLPARPRLLRRPGPDPRRGEHRARAPNTS